MAQLPTQSQFGDYGDWPGRDVLDSGGERLGGVREIYLDRETGRPEWVLVDVDDAEARFVPLADAAVESSAIRVAHSAATIREAPGIGTEPRIDESEERRLYDHYGIGYSQSESASGLPAEEPPREQDAVVVAETPEPETSSWSDAAGEEPSSLAPPPADPPTPDELDQADIPAPSAVTDATDSGRSPELAMAAAAEPAALAPADHEPPPPGPEAIQPESEQISPSATASDPDILTLPTPGVAEPDPVAASPRPATPPPPTPEPEPSGGAPDVIKSRTARIVTAVAIAALLLFILRRLR